MKQGSVSGSQDRAALASDVPLYGQARLVAGIAATPISVIGLPASPGQPLPLPLAFGLSLSQSLAAASLDQILADSQGLTEVSDLLADERFARHPLVGGPPRLRFLAHLPLFSSTGRRLGFLLVLDPTTRPGLTAGQAVSLGDVAGLIVAGREAEQRHADLARASSHALRTDHMLRLVSEAASCADALTSLLGELCHFHDAAIGRIWQVTSPGELLVEISRFNDDLLDEHSYYRLPPSEPVTASNSMTAHAIRCNEPHAVWYSQIEHPDRYALLSNAIASGLASQVSFPIWVQDQRFGIALAFSTERPDLADVVADLASMANTIRPQLFRKVAEERTLFVAHHDDLTRLANRLKFQDRLSRATAGAAQGKHGLALLYLDLDGFKQVNDLGGHEVGDKLLAAVADRLRENVREGDTVARIGGDEFTVIQPLGDQPSAATALAARLLDAIGQPFEIDGVQSVIGVSIGIAVHPRHGETPELLLRNADTALYRVKETGRNAFRVFEPSMNARRQDRLLIERDLSEAINQRHFALAYQPICDTHSLRTVGFEALLRWHHPTRGLLQPDQFVSFAEASGLILPLGRWALEAACAEAATWSRPACISVNFSPKQFRQPDLPQQIDDMLGRTGLAATRLDIEVTEGLLLDDTGLALRNMQALRERGIHVTLDDFGIGYASLSYLRRFPFDRIKIDRSFVQAMCDDDSTLAIVQAILSLSLRLNLAVVAEGVETERELEMLQRLGCGCIQGFLTGAPMSIEQARAQLV